MRLVLALSVLSVLAACGVDGAPVAPQKTTAQPGLTITGEAGIGVVKS